MIAEREAEWVDGFLWIDAGRERLSALTSHAWPVGQVPPEERLDENLVRGCQTPVWLTAARENDRLRLFCSSDSPLVAGLVRAMASVFDDAEFDEAERYEPIWIRELGMEDMLSPTRLNGLAAAKNRIRELSAGLKPAAETGRD